LRGVGGRKIVRRRQVFAKVKPLETAKCPLANLPEKDADRWGRGMTAEKMKEFVWVEPRIVAQVECLEWTGADHVRHRKFVALRDNKDPRSVGREI
jgi:ATP-dependent DNA ligase